MFAVYRVWCNFFHGNKRFGDETDRKFVASGAANVRGHFCTFGFILAKEWELEDTNHIIALFGEFQSGYAWITPARKIDFLLRSSR